MISKWDELRVTLSYYNIDEVNVARAVKEYLIKSGDTQSMHELDEYIKMYTTPK